jgi:predicted nucleic acid-binding Zn ribbon protein
MTRFDGRPDDADELYRNLGMNDDPTPLKRSIERLVEHLGAPPISILSQLHDRWPEVVGPGLAAQTRPIELVDKVLTVGCPEGAWAAQVGWMEAQIIDRFGAIFGPDLVERVSVRVDR